MKGPLWAMVLVLRRTPAQTGFLASRQLQHNRVLAIKVFSRGYLTTSSAALKMGHRTGVAVPMALVLLVDQQLVTAE